LLDSKSFLFVTIDSCRYDTFCSANLKNIRSVGHAYKSKSPSHFTFGSHSAMFMGFTPGIPELTQPYLNPKFGKIFKLANAGFEGKGTEFLTLTGRNIVDGLGRLGYVTIGSGGVGWFDPSTDTGSVLVKDFEHFYYPGNSYSLEKQLAFISDKMQENSAKPLFVFLNIGETHVPYYYSGATWDKNYNPCIPFGTQNDANVCRERQTKCLEFVDEKLGPLLDKFAHASTLICSDHGDCWGEDGLWEHGIHHEKVLTVPLIIRLNSKPI
jgi:hypothetical protein